MPADYLWWHEWAAEMAKTHTQKRCPGCGFWRQWEPKILEANGLDDRTLNEMHDAMMADARERGGK
jgi:hypothetical protein